MMFDRRTADLETLPFSPSVDDVGELAGAVIGVVAGQLVQGRDCLGQALVVDGFADR